MINILYQQIEMDRELEMFRQDLSLRADFILMDAFKYFDFSCKNYLTQRDFEKTLNDLGIFPSFD